MTCTKITFFAYHQVSKHFMNKVEITPDRRSSQIISYIHRVEYGMSAVKIKSRWLDRGWTFCVNPGLLHISVGWYVKWTWKIKPLLQRRGQSFPVHCRGEYSRCQGCYRLRKLFMTSLERWGLTAVHSHCTGQKVKVLHERWQIPLYFGHFPCYSILLAVSMSFLQTGPIPWRWPCFRDRGDFQCLWIYLWSGFHIAKMHCISHHESWFIGSRKWSYESQFKSHFSIVKQIFVLSTPDGRNQERFYSKCLAILHCGHKLCCWDSSRWHKELLRPTTHGFDPHLTV